MTSPRSETGGTLPAMPITTLETVPGQHRAVVYDGTNIGEVRALLSQQATPRLSVLNGTTCPFIRRDGKPDQALLPGDAILLDKDAWAHQASDAVLARVYRPVTSTWDG